MKVRPSVKKMCEKCKIIKRKGKVIVIPSTSSVRANDANHSMEVQLTNGAYFRC